jgi:Na+/H+ antiporter NhaD/arsenite permease-like protein
MTPGLGAALPLWSILPFAGMLLSIALFPLAAPHFWHRHYPKIAVGWGLVTAVPFLCVYGGAGLHTVLHTMLLEYLPFLILLWSLFTVAGGVVVRGSFSGTPRANVALLVIGTLVASCVGTTGASILLVHPLLRGLENRRHRAHTVVFFIFLVSNIGGALTPLGDPPLFLGFLSGVPFFWTLRCLPAMLFVTGLLLAVFFFLDQRYYARERMAPEAASPREPVRLDGVQNLPLLGGIVAFVLLSGVLRLPVLHFAGLEFPCRALLRDAALVCIGLVSLRITPRALRAANQFSWAPIREVAWLFAGIFLTMIPALEILSAGEAGPLHGLTHAANAPATYFWITGGLSSFLDNAPTYLTFLHTALGKFHPGLPTHAAVEQLVAENPHILLAISCGAVFMGANTYIGNAPNFMIRSIAEERGIAMPSFFGYLWRWSLPILVPCFLMVTAVFFR